MLRQLFQKLGRLNTVITITVFSTLFSVTLTYIVTHLMNEGENLGVLLVVSTCVPLIVAPFASWPFIDLLMKVDVLEKKMRRWATFDYLTGLLTRQAFFHDAKNYLYASKHEQMGFSILVVDLDKFKNINDTFGHSAGDEVLKDFATIVTTILREDDLVGRIGGEEFAIFLPNTTQDEAYEISERLHIAIRESSVNIVHSSIKYTVSTGLESSPPNEMDPIETILKRADQALYLAKERGRDRTVIFSTLKAY